MTTTYVRKDRTGWQLKLVDPSEIALMGCEWIPLPLTSEATFEVVVGHLGRLPHYAGNVVTEEG